jgi:hypothetical protein
VKRTRHIRLVLVGGLSAGALASCGPSGPQAQPISASNVYTNNYYVPGRGYYHAPFRDWYARPYNYFDAQTRRYFQGGQWAETPHQSITNISEPTPQAAQQAQAQRTDVRRSGFGSTSRSHSVFT